MKNKIQLTSILTLVVLVLISLGCLVYQTVAYLTEKQNTDVEYIVGDVECHLEIYFEKDGKKYGIDSEDIKIEFVGTTPSGKEFVKTGVIKVDISNRDAIQFAENLRVNLVVASDVFSYVRIAAYEQLTLVYESGGITREVAVVQSELTDFNYNFYNTDTNPSGQFYDNRTVDGYIYCMNQVKQNDDKSSFVVPLISEYYTDKNFGTRDSKYSLQLGFTVETVQYLQGAQNNWGLTNTPWGEDW